MPIDDKKGPETPLLERVVLADFRLWHILALCSGIVLCIIIMVCCCLRFRIPRTKQEIEADYRRKQITKKFRDKLAQIKNSEMDDMDLQKALTRIQTEFHNSLENLTKDHKDNNKLQRGIQSPI